MEQSIGNTNSEAISSTVEEVTHAPEDVAHWGRVAAVAELMSRMNGDLLPAITAAATAKEPGIIVFKRNVAEQSS